MSHTFHRFLPQYKRQVFFTILKPFSEQVCASKYETFYANLLFKIIVIVFHWWDQESAYCQTTAYHFAEAPQLPFVKRKVRDFLQQNTEKNEVAGVLAICYEYTVYTVTLMRIMAPMAAAVGFIGDESTLLTNYDLRHGVRIIMQLCNVIMCKLWQPNTPKLISDMYMIRYGLIMFGEFGLPNWHCCDMN